MKKIQLLSASVSGRGGPPGPPKNSVTRDKVRMQSDRLKSFVVHENPDVFLPCCTKKKSNLHFKQKVGSCSAAAPRNKLHRPTLVLGAAKIIKPSETQGESAGTGSLVEVPSEKGQLALRQGETGRGARENNSRRAKVAGKEHGA